MIGSAGIKRSQPNLFYIAVNPGTLQTCCLSDDFITRMKAFKPNILLGSIIAACLVFLPLCAIAQCTGLSKEPIFSGGDQNPITWSSLRNVLGQVVSYERKTENHSNQDVTDVYWPVAGYQKDVLPANTALCDQTTIPGEPDDKPGILNVGPGSTPFYQTTAYCPKAGWANSRLTNPGQAEPPALTSELQFAVRNHGKIEICTLHLKAAIEPASDGNTVRYVYYFENDGPAPLSVFWDIPRTKEYEEKFGMNAESPLHLYPNKLASITITAHEAPAGTPSTIYVFDGDHKVVGRSVVGVWGFAEGTTSFDFEKAWKDRDK